MGRGGPRGMRHNLTIAFLNLPGLKVKCLGVSFIVMRSK